MKSNDFANDSLQIYRCVAERTLTAGLYLIFDAAYYSQWQSTGFVTFSIISLGASEMSRMFSLGMPLICCNQLQLLK